MECVVCYERLEMARNTGCADPMCRGRRMVCGSCDAKLARCVYCRGRLRPSHPEPGNILVKMYVALYYSTLIGYFMGQVDDHWLDSASDGSSSSDSISDSIVSESDWGSPPSPLLSATSTEFS